MPTRNLATKIEYAVAVKAVAGHVEPYDPDAIDADGDGIVQEGTPWERPVGTRAFHQLLRGSADVEREIRRGETANLTGVRIGVGELGPTYGTTIPYVRKADIGTLTKAPAHDSKKFVADAKAEIEKHIPKGSTRKRALEEIDLDIQHIGEELKAGHHVPEHTELMKWLEEQRKVQEARKMSDDITIPNQDDLKVAALDWSNSNPSWARDTMDQVYDGIETADAEYDKLRKAHPPEEISFSNQSMFDFSWEEYLRNRRSAAAILNEVSDSVPQDDTLLRGEISEVPGYADSFVPGEEFTMGVRGFTRDAEHAALFHTLDPLKASDKKKDAVLFVIKPGDSTAFPLPYYADSQFPNEDEHLVAGTFKVVSKETRTSEYTKEPVTIITIVQTAPIPPQPKGADGQFGWR